MLARPYLPKLTDDSGSLIPMTGVTADKFKLQITNTQTETTVDGQGTWSIVTDPLDTIVKPSYAYAAADLATPGKFLLTVLMQQGDGTWLPFDPDFLEVTA